MSGDRSDAIAAVRSWYVDNASDVHGYAARRVGRHLADDVVADTFRQAIESFDSFDPEQGGERAWLFGIANNLLRRHWRTDTAWEHMSSSEAAAVLGIPAGTVRSRLHRIRKELDTVRFAAPAANDQKGDRT